MRRIAAALLALVVIGAAGAAHARCEGVSPGAPPQNASRDIVGKSLEEIEERGWIEFAVYENFPPWSWEEGGAKGVDVEIGRLIAESLGVEPRFRFVAASENLEADLRNHVWKGSVVGGGVANVMMHVPYDSAFACRVEQAVFTGQAYDETIAIAYRRDAYPEEKPVPAYFRFDTVAVENDTISDFYLTSLAGGQVRANIRRYPDYEAAMAALKAGEVMAAMGPRGQLERGADATVAVHAPPLPGLARGRWTVGVAVRGAYKALGYAVDGAVADALADGRIAAIFDRYGLTFTPPER